MKYIYNTIVAVALLSSVQAVTINMSQTAPRALKVVDTNGTTRIPVGSLVSLGYLGGAGNDTFTQFATTTISDTAAGSSSAGYLRLSITLSGTQAAIAGKQVYMWIYDTLLTTNEAKATADQGLFTSVGWVLPNTFASDSAASYNMVVGQTVEGAGPIVTSVAIPGVSGASFTVGNVATVATPTTINSFGFIYQLGSVAAIPETSTTLLGALGALALLRRRRN